MSIADVGARLNAALAGGSSKVVQSQRGTSPATAARRAEQVNRDPVHVWLLTDKPHSYGDGTSRIVEELHDRGAVVHALDMNHLRKDAVTGTWMIGDRVAPHADAVIPYHGAEMPRERGLDILRKLEADKVWLSLGSRVADLTQHKGRFARWGEQRGLAVIPHIDADSPAAAERTVSKWGDKLIWKDPVGTKGEEVEGVHGLAEALKRVDPEKPGMLQPRLNLKDRQGRVRDIRIVTMQEPDGSIREMVSAARELTDRGKELGAVKTNFSQNAITGEELVTGYRYKPTRKQLKVARDSHRELAREGNMVIAGTDVLTDWRTSRVGRLIDRVPALRRERTPESNNSPGNAEELVPGFDQYGPLAQRAIDEGLNARAAGKSVMHPNRDWGFDQIFSTTPRFKGQQPIARSNPLAD